jgi:hypothetical protein
MELFRERPGFGADVKLKAWRIVRAGLPRTWRGWAVLASFGAGVVANAFLWRGFVRAATVALLIGALVMICLVKTEDGWRWRWP